MVSPTHTQAPALHCCSAWIGPCWLLHTCSKKIPIIPKGCEHSCYTRTSSIFVHSLLLLCYFQIWLENRRTLVEHIVRDAPRFNGERAHWVDYKEKLDDVLFSHRSSLRDILQGQTRPDKYVLIPNDVTVVPTYVELRRSIYETQPIPEQWRGNAEREAHWSTGQDVARAAAELAGPVTPAAPIAGSVIGHTDLTLPNSLGFHGRFQVIAGSTAGTSFLKKPACELWDRENDELFRILYHT